MFYVCVYQLYQLSFFAMLHPENPLLSIFVFCFFKRVETPARHSATEKHKSITAVAGKSLTVEVSAPGPAPRAAGRHPSWGSAPILQRGGFRSAATPLPKRCAERPTLDHLSELYFLRYRSSAAD